MRSCAPRLRPERTVGDAGCAKAQAHDSLAAPLRKTCAIRRRRDRPHTARHCIARAARHCIACTARHCIACTARHCIAHTARHCIACARYCIACARSRFRTAERTGTDGFVVTPLA